MLDIELSSLRMLGYSCRYVVRLDNEDWSINVSVRSWPAVAATNPADVRVLKCNMEGFVE